MTVMITTVVVAWTSFLLGNVTFRISLRTSVRKPFMRAGNCVTLLPWSSRAIVTAFAIGSFLKSTQPLAVSDHAFSNPARHLTAQTKRYAQTPKIWQGRRDSNPQVRFWRPAV